MESMPGRVYLNGLFDYGHEEQGGSQGWLSGPGELSGLSQGSCWRGCFGETIDS